MKKKKQDWQTDVTQITPQARDHLNAVIKDRFEQYLTPPPRLNVAEWCNENRIVADIASPEAGPYRWQRAPYQYEMLQVAGDVTTRRLVLMMAIQTGKTICLENIIAYYMANDPAPMMVVMPSRDTAEKWSETKLQPMIDSTPALRGLVQASRERDSSNRKRFKGFPSGFIVLVSARAGNELVMLTARILLMDEVDKYPPAIETGDPVSLCRGRTSNWWNSKEIMVSSPTYTETSRIYEEFQGSDQRYYYIPCPHCGQFQVIRWKNIKYENDDPSTAVFECGFIETNIKNKEWRKDNRYYTKDADFITCGKRSTEAKKHSMLVKGVWIAHNPDSKVPGFHLSAMYSPWVEWADLVAEWVNIKTPFQRMTFTNSRLAEPWQDYTDIIKAHELVTRLERYDADKIIKSNIGEEILIPGCPTGVGVIVVGIDVQHDVLYAYVWGIGQHSEMWNIHNVRFDGNTQQDRVWQELAHFMETTSYPTTRGAEVIPSVWVIDSSDQTHAVYRFTRDMQRQGFNIIAIKGSSQINDPPIPSSPSKARDYGINFYVIGVNQIKDGLMPMFKNDTHGPGFIHLRLGLTEAYLKELTAETRELKIHPKTGRPVRRWINYGNKPNHAFDGWIYAYWGYLFQYERQNVSMLDLSKKIRDAAPTQPQKEKTIKKDNVIQIPPRQIQTTKKGQPKSIFGQGNWYHGYK